jgi:hypothetical protein
MFETRLATAADAELIGEQRHRMFVDSVQTDDAQMMKVVSLHASTFGKPLYERNGFELSNEMILRH